MGIKSGAGSVTFGKDGAFSTQMGNYKLSGTYTFDPSTHVAAMKFAKEKLGKEKLDLGEVPGHVSLSLSLIHISLWPTKRHSGAWRSSRSPSWP